jgi:outer membrane protein OmpA-like peptidoglycan-associated protein/stage V sporulation protein SpoVS
MNGTRGFSNSGSSPSPDFPDSNSVKELLELLLDLDLINKAAAGSKHSGVGAKHSERKSRVSAMDYGPNASPVQKSGVESKIQNPKSKIQNYPSLPQRIVNLETKLTNLEQQIYQPTDLINPLLPLIRELLSLKTGESREAILEAVVPVVDEILKKRGKEEPQKMSEALAGLLPSAISQEIQDTPTAIGKAIAPEIALAFQEQSRLDSNAISQALGPEMGKAIKVQIVEEQDAMIDALYPVIGNTISRYMVEMVAEINEKVEKALSFQGVQRRIRARLRGVSEAQLILQESMDFNIQILFLVHKASGLIIWEAQPPASATMNSDLIAGMLTAMREFASNCVTPSGKVSELHEIDFDGTTILLEVAGYCYLAAIVAGKPSPAFLQNLRQALGEVVLHYGEAIKEFSGNSASFPKKPQLRLEKLLEPQAKEKVKKPPYVLLLLLLAFLLPLGFFAYRSHLAAETEKRVAEALDAAPELSVYRLIPQVSNLIPKIGSGKLTLTGRVPHPSLRQRAEQIARTAAPDLELDNQIQSVDVPPTVNQVGQIINLFNLLNLRAYFAFNSSQLEAADEKALVPFVVQFLAANPQVHLRLVGYSDPVGNAESKQKLAIARARTVQQALIAQGVNPARLHLDSRLSLPPRQAGDSPTWLSRCVLFEAFLPPATEN